MKTINYTTTGSLFNHTGILSHAGDYAGKYQDEAFVILEKNDDFKESRFGDSKWADIMHDNFGTCYAVFAEGELTMYNAQCIYVEFEKEDCEKAFNEAQTHLG